MIPWHFDQLSMQQTLDPQAAKAAIYALSFAQDSGAHLYFCHVLGVHEMKGSEKPVLQASLKDPSRSSSLNLRTIGAARSV